jgi:hypothetical protein
MSTKKFRLDFQTRKAHTGRMTTPFGPPATFTVTPLGQTPQEGFKVEGPAGLVRFVGEGAPFGAFQLTCFGMAVRAVLEA